MDLAPWIGDDTSAEPLAALTTDGLRALDRARTHPGRVRQSAFDLLAADALLSWACEAALEQPDPGAALDALLRRTVDLG